MPATSIVQLITTAIQNAVGGISSSSGYATASVVAENFMPALSDDAAADVIVGVFLAGLQVEESEIKSLAGRQTFDSPTDVIVQLKCILRTSTQSAEQDKQNLVRDLQAAIFADRSLGFAASGINGTVTVMTISFQNFVYQPSENAVLVGFDGIVRVHCLTNPSAP